jgi:poly(3-hydroxybutyrate) depolymerase
MDPIGYVYVPNNCYKYQCYVHVALHGCNQSKSSIGTTFVEDTGYLEWAAQNNLIILFPQAIMTSDNESGCWDFFGFTGDNYDSKDGEMPKAIMEILQQLQSRESIK